MIDPVDEARAIARMLRSRSTIFWASGPTRRVLRAICRAERRTDPLRSAMFEALARELRNEKIEFPFGKAFRPGTFIGVDRASGPDHGVAYTINADVSREILQERTVTRTYLVDPALGVKPL